MKKFLQDFKKFALQGNVMDLAVGVIIGAAFQSIVTSLTDNIISPIIGLFTGQSFDEWGLNVFGVTIKYGAFITSIINFLITALIVFFLVRAIASLKKIGHHEKEATPEKRDCPYCYSSISVKATRCPDCTSEVNPLVQAKPAE